MLFIQRNFAITEEGHSEMLWPEYFENRVHV